MQNKPLLSIHLMTYNSERYMSECLESIVSQKVNFTYEVIITDDSSIDKTFDIVQSYQKKYPKLIFSERNIKNIGLIKNYFKTLDKCSGRYIFDIAGDDYLKNGTALQLMVDTFIKNPNLGFIDFQFDILTNKRIIKKANNRHIEITNKEAKKQYFLSNIWSNGTIYKKEALVKYVNREEYINHNITVEDYATMVDLSQNTSFKFMDFSVLVYRRHDTSLSNPQNFYSLLKITKEINNDKLFFADKYNISKEWIKIAQTEHLKNKIRIAGRYNKSKYAQKYFSELIRINYKSILDFSLLINFMSAHLKILGTFINRYRKVT